MLLTWSCIVVLAVMVWSLSRLALLYVLTDGLLAVSIVLAGSTFGMWAVPLFFPRRSLGLRWHFLLGAGLGVGLLSLLMLMLGLAGLLSKSVCLGMLIVMGGVGLVRLSILLMRYQRSLMPQDRQYDKQPPRGRFNAVYILLLALMPFLALSLLVATVPPGVLWAEEAFGYDVLEYHLQVPKEYHIRGQITYLPHNIYSNFPMNAEMLYLLAMTLKEDPIEASVLAKLLNVLLGVLFVLSAWVIGREYHPTAGVVCALLAGSAPWLMFLCGIAYVENGMLFFGMLSAACLCLYDKPRHRVRSSWRLALLAGLFAGLSCGFKYTAVVMIAGPLFVMLCALSAGKEVGNNGGASRYEGPRGLQPRRTRTKPAARKRLQVVCHPLLFVLGALVTFSPWLIKNIAMTGNPVFPLAYSLFGASEGVWSDDLAEQWQQGHQVEAEDASLQDRLARFKERILMDRRLGWWLICLAVPILFSTARSRLDIAMFAVFVIQAVVWIAFTHLFARFAVAMLIPLCILGGRSMIASNRKWYRLALTSAVVAVVVLNLFSAGAIYAAEVVQIQKNADIHGHVERFYRDCDADTTPVGFVRQRLEQGSRVLMVGDARAFYMPETVDYCVVFNRNPLAEAVAGANNDDDIIRWLNAKGYDYLLVFWNEMERLRNTYGFWAELTPMLFGRLEDLGLAVVKEFRAGGPHPYATLYEVRIMPPPRTHPAPTEP